jgi:hypothetical protein
MEKRKKNRAITRMVTLSKNDAKCKKNAGNFRLFFEFD